MNVQCKRCGLGKTRLRHPSLPFDSLPYPTRTIRRRVRSVNHLTTKGKEVDHNLWVWGSVPRALRARGSHAIRNTIIWNNKDIKIDNNTIFFRNWFSRGVSTVENLLDHNLDFITYEQFKTRYQIKTNFLTYYGAINAIPNEYKKSIKQTNAQQGQPTQSELESTNNQGYT